MNSQMNNTQTETANRRAHPTAEGVAVHLTQWDTRLIDWRQIDNPVIVALWVERLRQSCPLTDGVEAIADFLDVVYKHNGWDKDNESLAATIAKGITNRRPKRWGKWW